MAEAGWVGKGDRDIHLVIAARSDHSLTMIVEFPDPACVNAAPAVMKMMRDARNAFIACRGLMPSANKPFQQLSGTATINGVGFFDRPHATGHAPGGIETHAVPVLQQHGLPLIRHGSRLWELDALEAAVVADFTEELRPQVPQIAQALLPQPPITKAEVLSVDIGDPVSQAMIRYTGSSGAVTIRSDWQDEGGRPVIVRAEPAS